MNDVFKCDSRIWRTFKCDSCNYHTDLSGSDQIRRPYWAAGSLEEMRRLKMIPNINDAFKDDSRIRRKFQGDRQQAVVSRRQQRWAAEGGGRRKEEDDEEVRRRSQCKNLEP